MQPKVFFPYLMNEENYLKGGQQVDDSAIIGLYRKRSEQAVKETEIFSLNIVKYYMSIILVIHGNT